MGPYKKIDYSKFKCEVYSPEGMLLQEARINALNDFYCSWLVPGHDYYVVFSYDDIMIESLLFNCDDSGKVVFISPAHIIFNNGVYIPPRTFVNGVKGKVKRREEYNVPRMRWAKKAIDAFIDSTHESSSRKRRKSKHALDSFIESTHEGVKRGVCPSQFLVFKAGAGLAKSVK